MAVIMVEERFDPPIDLSQGSPVADKVSPCLPVYDVTWMSSYIASDGTRCVCVYEAENAEAVTTRLPNRRCALRERLGRQSPTHSGD